MEFRDGPSRHDPTAQRFLGAAAELIDAYLRAGPDQPSGRLRHIRFPSALEWLRTEDVIRVAGGANSREFFSRWATREEFLPDAVVYALLRDYEAHDPQEYVERIPAIPEALTPVSALIMGVAEGLLTTLIRHPRSYLMLHIGPLLPRHPELFDALPRPRAVARVWVRLYEQLVAGLDLVMRPEWSLEHTSLVLHAMLDGFVLRHRLQRGELRMSRWEGASIFADAIIAFILGAVDWDLTGETGRTALDTLVRPQLRKAPRW